MKRWWGTTWRNKIWRRVLHPLVVAVITSACGSACAVTPEEVAQVGIHNLEIVRLEPFGGQARIGKQILYEGGLLGIKRVYNAGKKGVAVLTANNGGNACPIDHVIISVDGNDFEVTKPFGRCGDATEIIGDVGRLTLRFDPGPAYSGYLYHWTANGGLQKPEKILFSPTPGTGWYSARELVGQHPQQIFYNAEIYAALKQLLQADFDDFVMSLGAAPANMKLSDANWIVGSGCMPHNCLYANSFVILDLNKRAAYAALARENQSTTIRPDVNSWPKPMLSLLGAWFKEISHSP